ncbi:Phosphate-selective porin O and P [Flavobacteria bacterium BAL38]|nr:Phosphate-selective porin O and P [Flavobacteria bacterium BAL38]
MKFFKIIIFFCFVFTLPNTHAQNIKMEAYKFGEGLKFKTDDGKELEISGYIQPYLESKHYTNAQDLEAANRFRMRRTRLRFDGKSSDKKFSYRLQVDLSGSSEVDEETANYLLDAYINYDITKRINITFGQRATYTDNRELFMNSNSLQFVERSRLTSAFSSIREFGLFIDGRYKTGKYSYLRPYFVLTNGDGLNVLGRDHGGLKIGGRIDFLPFGLFNNGGQFKQTDIVRERTPKFVIGVNYSLNNGMSSRRGRTSGTILYYNDNNEESLPDYTKYGVDFLFKYKGFTALGEFVKSQASVPNDITQRVRVDGTISSTFDVNGVQNVDAYVRGRMMLGEAYNIQAGYLFKNGISVDGRYTYLKADENSFLNNQTVYNRPNYYSVGLSKYLDRNFGAKIQAAFTYVDGSKGINDNDGNPIDSNEWIGRLMLTFTF